MATSDYEPKVHFQPPQGFAAFTDCPEQCLTMADGLPQDWPVEQMSYTIDRLKVLTKLLENQVGGGETGLSDQETSSIACTVRGQVELMEKLFDYGVASQNAKEKREKANDQ